MIIVEFTLFWINKIEIWLFLEFEGYRAPYEGEFSINKAYAHEFLERATNPPIDTYYNSVDITNHKFYESGEVAPHPEVKGTVRCGAIAKKVGMMTLYDQWGMQVPVTVLHVDRCQIIQHKTVEKNGYNAI